MLRETINFSKYNFAPDGRYWRFKGKVVNVVGLTIESAGPDAKIGDICVIYPQSETAAPVMAEVVGFRHGKNLLMPYEKMEGVGRGSIVENTETTLTVAVNDSLLGKTLDGLGRPIGDISAADDGSFVAAEGLDVGFEYKSIADDSAGMNEEKSESLRYSVEALPPDPLKRKLIADVLPLGVKAVDGLLTVGKGQRIGIFAGSGVGKSTLLGMFARNTKADVNVLALIGERGREVREFIERDLGAEGMARSVVVVATSDKPALERNKAAKTATAIAEYFRDQGKDVLFMMDSLTRFSMAQREIGLASGEPPVSRGYPPSVYAEMPKLLERAGCVSHGSITGLYTVLVDGDDFNEPITDTARSILDGHILLNRRLAHRNHYPAIDVLQSISRCMAQIIDRDHKQLAGRLKNVLATYAEAEDLINIGAYRQGSNKNIDFAIEKIDAINEYLCQDVEMKYTFAETMELLEVIFADG
ncbi:MAG: FliI/YscN family ATPase [Lachnospiraceae bacterium]|jgi:flagellum-specific ATP synthase|nr:FliI/YscN family ATPase [Lachnospiraceae bacterium]